MGGFSLLFQWLQSGGGNKHSNCHSFLPISKKMHINGFISSHYLFNTYPLLCYSSTPLFISLYGLSSQCPHPYFSVTFSFSMVSHLCNESSLNALHTLFFTDDCILGCFTLHLELLPPLKHKNEEDKAIYFSQIYPQPLKHSWCMKECMRKIWTRDWSQNAVPCHFPLICSCDYLCLYNYFSDEE